MQNFIGFNLIHVMFYEVLMAFTTLVITDWRLIVLFCCFILSMYLSVIWIPFQIVYSVAVEVGCFLFGKSV